MVGNMCMNEVMSMWLYDGRVEFRHAGSVRLAVWLFLQNMPVSFIFGSSQKAAPGWTDWKRTLSCRWLLSKSFWQQIYALSKSAGARPPSWTSSQCALPSQRCFQTRRRVQAVIKSHCVQGQSFGVISLEANSS